MSIYGTTWGTFQSLKGSLADDPAVVATADRRLIVFAQGGSNTLWYTWQGRDLSWQTWVQFQGASITGVPAAILGADGLVRVFWRSTAGALFTASFDNIIGTFSQAPTQLAGNTAGDPAATLGADGRVYVFYRGTDGAVWYVSHTSVSYNAWNATVLLGGQILGNPSPILSMGGRVKVYVRGTDNNLWEAVQQNPDSATWNAFTQLATATGLATDPKAGRDADARLRVFWLGTDGAAHFIGQQAGYTTWNPAGSLSGQVVTTPYPILAIDGRIEAFARGTANDAQGTEQQSVNTDTFTTFSTLGGIITGNAIPVPQQDGRTAVFVRGSDKAIWYAPQNWT